MALESTANAVVTPPTCPSVLEAPYFRDHVEALAAGAPTFTHGGSFFALDEPTIQDLEIDALEGVLAPFLPTDFGRRRWAFMLRHPDLTHAADRQALIREIADHPEDFVSIEQSFAAINDAELHLLERFTKLKAHDESVTLEVLWGIYFWANLILPTAAHFALHTSPYWSAFFAAQAWATAMGNVKRVRRLRDGLEPYRFHLENAKSAARALGAMNTPLARELGAALDPRRAPPAVRPLDRVAGLIDRIRGFLFGRGQDPFRAVRDRLRRMEPQVWTKIWGIPIGTDLALQADRLFISNVRLRGLQRKLLAHKEDMAQLFAALGEFEVYFALAKFYRERKSTWIFLEVREAGAGGPQIHVQGARPIVMAAREYDATTKSDLELGGASGEPTVEVLAGNPSQGARARLKMYGQYSLAALVGLPVPADRGSVTPNVVVSQLHPVVGTRKRGPLRAEAQRWAEIQTITELYPDVLVLLNEPFTSTGDVRSLAFRIEVVRELIARTCIGVMSTRSRSLLQAISAWPNVNLMQIEDYVAVPFDPGKLDAVLDPEDTFKTFLDEQVTPEFVEHARETMRSLTRASAGRRRELSSKF